MKCPKCGGELLDASAEPFSNKQFFLTVADFSSEPTSVFPDKGIPLKIKMCKTCNYLELYRDIETMKKHM